MCKECRERREKLIDAALQGRLIAAAGHAVTGGVEMVGLKPKAKPTRKPPKTED
jgi:hypothetical protein